MEYKNRPTAAFLSIYNPVSTFESRESTTTIATFLCLAARVGDVKNKARICGRSVLLLYIMSQTFSALYW